MNDLGVSLHAHNAAPDFLSAARALLADNGSVTFDPRYLAPFRLAKADSPIVGVTRHVPVFKDRTLAAFLDRPAAQVEFPGSLDQYANLAVARLQDHILQHWDDDRPTLVCHSSGYDSRILSSCLAELRDLGYDLGRVHFRCRPPEGESFLEIMRRQRWKPDQYSVFEMPADDPMDVGAWDRPGVSGWLPVTSQINFWRDLVPYDEEKNWNLFGGSGGGEASEYPSQGKPPTVDWTFVRNERVQRWFSYFPDGTDFAADVESRFAKVMFPYFGAGHIRTVAECPARFYGFHPSGCDNVRAAMLEQFDEDTLDVPRIHRTYAWSISDRRWAEMRARYAASMFARDVPGAPAADALIAEMRANFFGRNSTAERIWRLASVWEVIHGGSK